ncbi:MAG TPA: phosphoenolpyruvate-utilizing N-terminal domain-containing protein, partial [Corynebacterium sp.]|nr:phosphoenolpyruvate-utilizing N-terminal domain-containing protein [Corynebacterium sp.]
MTMTARQVLHGVGVSPGVAAAPAAHILPPPGIDPGEPASANPDQDTRRVRDALNQVAGELRAGAEATEGEARAILAATARLAADPALLAAVNDRLRA